MAMRGVQSNWNYLLMKNLIYAIILLALCACAKASVFSIESAQFNDGVEYVGPYSSLLDGNQVISFCIDLNSQVGFHQQFDVTVVSLANFQGSNDDKKMYREEGWLAEQTFGLTDVATLSAIQRAIWMVPGLTSTYLATPDSLAWLALAEAHEHDTSLDSGITLYLSGAGGQSQIGVVPEISTQASIILLGASMLFFMYLGRKQRAAK